MAFSNVLPAISSSLRVSHPQIIANWAALETALGANHDFTTGSTQTGVHTNIIAKEQSGNPTVAANQSSLFCKEADGKCNWHLKDEDATVTQLTSAGKIRSAATDMLDEDDMASDSATKTPSQQSVKAYVDSGTVTMTNKTLTSPVINTGISGTAIKDEDDMASDSATAVPTQQSTKAYVDAGLATKSGLMTPSSYAGEESITFPNGMILKQGYVVDSGTGTTTVTFASAFPTASISCQVTAKRATSTTRGDVVSGLTTSTLTIKCPAGVTGWYWQAWGY